MSFDPDKPFDVVSAGESPAATFNPEQPFEVVANPEAAPAASSFDPSQPFEVEYDGPPQITAATQPGLLRRAATAVRESLAPLIGPAPNQRLRQEQDAQAFAEALPQIAAAAPRPNLVETEGFVPAMFTPTEGTPWMLPQIQADADSGGAAQTGAGLFNVGAGVVNSMIASPGGLLSLPAGPAMVASKVARGVFAADMGRQAIEAIPDAVRTVRDPNATVQQQVEAVAAPVLAAGAALATAPRPARKQFIDVEVMPDAAEAAGVAAARASRQPVAPVLEAPAAAALPEPAPVADLPALTPTAERRVLELAPAPEILRIAGSAEGGAVSARNVATDLPEASMPAAPASGAPRKAKRVAQEQMDKLETTGWIPSGEPGVRIEPGPMPPAFGGGWVSAVDDVERRVVFRDEQGKPRGYLRFSLVNPASKAVDAAEGLNVYVAPEFRRQGIATQLYEAAQRAGYDVRSVSGSGALTPMGEQLSASIRGTGDSLPPGQPAQVIQAAPPGAAAGEGGVRSASVLPGAADPVAVAPERKPKGRGFALSPLPDGSPDLLNAIEDLGGIRGPRDGARGGEYDGFGEVFNSGIPRLLRNRGGQAVDQLIGELAEQGYRFDTPDAFYSAVRQASETRQAARGEMERLMQGDKFHAAALENRGRAAGETAAKPVAVDALQVGDKFKVKREAFEVVDVDPDTGDVIVNDGPRFGRQVLPAGQEFFPDRRTLRRVPRDEAASFLPEGDEAPGAGFDPSQPFEVVAQPEPAPVAAGGDLLGADAPFNLASEVVPDAEAALRRVEARREAATAQGEMFGGETRATPPTWMDRMRGQSLGIAPGADSFARLTKLMDPQSVLPEVFRTATRYSDQAQAGVLARAKAVQEDLRRALGRARKAAPGVDAETFGYLTGARPLAALPAEVRYPAQQARALVDGLSDRAIREGVVKGDLANTFADNIGTYLRRSYRLFADPTYWPEQQVRDDARRFIEANWSKSGPIPRREAETIVKQLLDREAAPAFMLGGKIAGRDVSSLMRRRDLAPEIRRLYGEITDPLEAFGQTVPRLASLIENHAAQQWIRLAGLKDGVFSTTPTPLNHRELVSATNKPHEVWRGLFTTPEIAEAMQREATTKSRALSIGEMVGNVIRTGTSLAKMGKTVLNPDSYAPNVIGGLVTMAANGNFNVLPGGRGLLLAAEELGALRAAGVLPQSRVGLQRDIEKLGKLGLRGEGVAAADLLKTWEKSLLPKLWEKGGKIVRPWLRGYGAIDDTTKYMAWKSELARLKSWDPGAPLAQLEREAAERVRATMPTYSQIPKWVRQASQLGIAPSFVSFTYEMFRNTANTARMAAQDMAEGTRSGNGARTRDGARRLASLMTVLGVSSGAGLALLSRWQNDVSEEQDEAVRYFGAPWNREGMLAYNKPVEGGRAQFSNISYLLPHALLFEALGAGLRGDTGEDMAGRFLTQLKNQFLSADGGVFLGPAVEAYVGTDRETGRPVINRESPTPTADAFGYIYDRSLHPLALDKLERSIKAMRGETGPAGRVYSLGEEGLRLAGVRAQTMDFKQAAEFKARELARRWSDASNLYRTVRGRGVAPEALEAAYQRGEEARQKVFGDLEDYLRLGRVGGVDEDSLVKNLRETTGMDAPALLALLDGEYTPQEREQRDTAAKILERVQSLPEQERAAELVQVLMDNPRVLKPMLAEVERQAKGITQRDRLVLALDVADGSRARHVVRQIQKLGGEPEAVAAYVGELRRKGILSDQVVKQLQSGTWREAE